MPDLAARHARPSSFKWGPTRAAHQSPRTTEARQSPGLSHGRKFPLVAEKTTDKPKPTTLIERLRERRATLRADRDKILDRTAGHDDVDLSADELATFNELTSKLDDLDDQVEQARDAEIAELRAAAARIQQQVDDGPDDERPVWPFVPARALTRARAHVTDPLIYDPQGRNSWVRDVTTATLNPASSEARERLGRHELQMVEQRVMTSYQPGNSLTAGGALTPPAWLLAELATVARAGRPLADAIGSQPLPMGVDQLFVPTASQGGLTGVQATETTNIAAQDWVTAQLNSQIATVAGQVDISQALIDQSPAQVDQIILGDLLADLALRVDDQIINGTGAANQVNGLVTLTPGTAVAYTTAAPAYTSATTANSFVFQITKAINGVATQRKRAPQVIVMHPRRWAWVTTALDSQNRPMVVPTAEMNAYGRVNDVAAEAIVGTQSGLPVLLDATIPTNKGVGTNQDQVYVLRLDDLRIWESTPIARAMVAPLSAQLGVRLQVYGYLAAILNRYAGSIARIDGTGLVDPGL
jgi:HK97 family phage major capsid protein